MMDLSQLSAEFHPASVHWRVQGTPFKGRDGYSALALAYLDARDVMDRLDDVCGPANWQTEFTETAKGRVICRLGILAGPDWVWKSDGAGDTDVEGDKGGISDALKRAAVSWGIGRYLYRLPSPWVPCDVSEKGGKVYWKAWSVDPWSKVRQPDKAPQRPAQKAQEASEPQRDPRKIADSLIAKVEACRTWSQLDDLLAAEKFDQAWEWLEVERPPMALEVKKAVEAKKRQFDPAMQAPEKAA
jgi:hypothetical protein